MAHIINTRVKTGNVLSLSGSSIELTGAVNFANPITAPSFTGSLSGSVAGNATTATTLQTARTLTIGSSGKSFNGSADVSWTLTEIGAVGTSANNTFTGVNTFSNNYITASVGVTGSDAKFTSITGTLSGNITGNAATVTNGVYTTTIATVATTGVTAGSGLTGGGTTGSLTINVGAGTGITVAADTVGIDTTAVATLSGTQTFTGAKTFQASTTLSGAVYVSYATTNVAYSVSATDNVVFATGGAYTITIPSAAANAGRQIIVKKAESSELAITLSASAGTIDGGTFDLNGPYQSVILVSNGSNWFVM